MPSEWRQVPENEVVRDLTYQAMTPEVIPPDKFGDILVWAPSPDDHSPHMIDLAQFGERPRRTTAGITKVRDEKSLIDVCNKLGSDVRVYADPVARAVIAILNDDQTSDTAGWRDRRVVLELWPTPEWVDWNDSDNKLMSQRAFAEFIEDHLVDIFEPAAADMLELAQDLEATQSATFASGVKLQSGARQFEYRETTEATGPGIMLVPSMFKVALTPWQGREGAPFEISARLRYRVSPQGLQLGYKLVDVDRILTTAFNNDIVEPIRSAGLDVVLGTP